MIALFRGSTFSRFITDAFLYRLKLKCDKTVPCSRFVLSPKSYSLHNIDPFMVHFDSAYPAYTVVSVEDVLPFVPMEVSLPGKELGE